jgi:hypothetical protein
VISTRREKWDTKDVSQMDKVSQKQRAEIVHFMAEALCTRPPKPTHRFRLNFDRQDVRPE